MLKVGFIAYKRAVAGISQGFVHCFGNIDRPFYRSVSIKINASTWQRIGIIGIYYIPLDGVTTRNLLKGIVELIKKDKSTFEKVKKICFFFY